MAAREEVGDGSGWIGFAGVMLLLVGTFNIIDGIAAIANSDYIVNQLLFANLDAWGWFFLIWGIIQVFAGLAIWRGATWGVIAGIVTAFFNAIAQLSWMQAYPVWSICILVLDILVLYGLVAYGFRPRTSYD
jgi:hypothetical protein